MLTLLMSGRQSPSGIRSTMSSWQIRESCLINASKNHPSSRDDTHLGIFGKSRSGNFVFMSTTIEPFHMRIALVGRGTRLLSFAFLLYWNKIAGRSERDGPQFFWSGWKHVLSSGADPLGRGTPMAHSQHLVCCNADLISLTVVPEFGHLINHVQADFLCKICCGA